MNYNLKEFYLRFFNHFLIFLFFFAFLTPGLGAIDIKVSQYFILSILSILGFVYIYVGLKKNFLVINFDKNKLNYFNLYSCFILTSFVSIYFSENTVESLVVFSQYFTIFSVLSIFLVLLNNINNPLEFCFRLILVALFFETIYIIYQAISFYNLNQFFYRSNDMRGFSGNINIASFSIAYKLPIAIYYLFKNSRNMKVILFIIIISFSILAMVLMGSRGGYVSLIVIVFMSLFSIFYFYKSKLKLISILFISFLFPVILSQNVLKNTDLDPIERASSISINTFDGSVNQRIRYYKHTLQSFLENPVSGIGIGNWKLKSIEYDKNDILQYIVPYHAHNDFLEVLAEQGVFGFIFFISLFVIIFYYLIMLLLRPKEKTKEVYFMFVFLIIYIIDCNLNFPTSRPGPHINFIFMSSLIYVIYNNELGVKKREFNNTTYLKLFFFIIISGAALISNYYVYNSYKFQGKLLYDWDKTKLELPIEYVRKVNHIYPNLSATVLPMSVIKARYYVQEGITDSLFKFLDIADKVNPYLGVSESVRAQYYFNTNSSYDSAYKYSKMAFEKLPNNINHSDVYFNIISSKGKEKELTKAFNKISFKSSDVWLNYLNSLYKIKGHGDQDLINILDKIQGKFSNKNEKFNMLKKLIKIGKINFALANTYQERAKIFFNNGELNEALNNYNQALSIDSEEYSYYENIGLIYFKLDNYELALENFEKVIDSFPKFSGKSLFYKAIIILDLGKQDEMCVLLRKSLSNGFKPAEDLLKKYCY
tara:strand:+ start:1547 stop:3841 length:2295 start_codon:yes stop_codon:yes gene_type:complete